MRTIALLILVLLRPLGTRGEDAFFKELESIYVTVLCDSMPDLKGQPFSMALGRSGDGKAPFHKIPDQVWARLAARLKEQGVDSSGYVPADRVEIRNGVAIVSGTKKRVSMWSIVGTDWRGDARVWVSKMMFRDGLTGQFYTAILEREAGRWVIKERTNQGMAKVRKPSAHASAQ